MWQGLIGGGGILMGCAAAEATGLGVFCFVVINPCLWSANRVDLFVPSIFQFYPPPPFIFSSKFPSFYIPGYISRWWVLIICMLFFFCLIHCLVLSCILHNICVSSYLVRFIINIGRRRFCCRKQIWIYIVYDINFDLYLGIHHTWRIDLELSCIIWESDKFLRITIKFHGIPSRSHIEIGRLKDWLEPSRWARVIASNGCRTKQLYNDDLTVFLGPCWSPINAPICALTISIYVSYFSQYIELSLLPASIP